MPKYLDPEGISYLWSKIKHIENNKLIYYSNSKENWDLNPNFLSEKNVLYIYTDYATIDKDDKEITIPGLKIGDGKSYLIDLPFVNDSSNFNEILIDHINNNVIHISAYDRLFWNNKQRIRREFHLCLRFQKSLYLVEPLMI